MALEKLSLAARRELRCERASAHLSKSRAAGAFSFVVFFGHEIRDVPQNSQPPWRKRFFACVTYIKLSVKMNALSISAAELEVRTRKTSVSFSRSDAPIEKSAEIYTTRSSWSDTDAKPPYRTHLGEDDNGDFAT